MAVGVARVFGDVLIDTNIRAVGFRGAAAAVFLGCLEVVAIGHCRCGLKVACIAESIFSLFSGLVFVTTASCACDLLNTTKAI